MFASHRAGFRFITSFDVSTRSADQRPVTSAEGAAEDATGTVAVDVEEDVVASVRDLRVSFERDGREVHALRGLSLDIAPGEIVALVGESGSGKSVLGLSLLGLLPARSKPTVHGDITVCGVDLAWASEVELRTLRRERLGAVFQDPMTSLNPTMRIGRQLQEATGSREASLALLEAVGIPNPSGRLRSYPHQLSGGQRQRIMIAMAMAGNPRLVVADEPTTALDVTVQAQILRLIRDLRADSGSSFLFITHDLGVAQEIADRVVVMYGGRIVEVGATADVLSAPDHPYTAALGAARLTLGSDRRRPLRIIAGEPPSTDPGDRGCAFANRCPLRIDVCDTAVPILQTVDDDRLAACHRPGVPTEAVVESAVWPAPHRPVDNYALEVVGLTKTFRTRGRKGFSVKALDDVDLRVGPGEAVSIVGESGSGKSTLLRAIAKLDGVDEGQIAMPPDTNVQLVFQDAGASLTPWLSIGELLRERLRAVGTPKSRVEGEIMRALERAGLPASVAAVRPANLSGGQRQRAALARALVVPPKLLLCDEPTSALDASFAAVLLNALGALRRELGMAMLFVTHDFAVARLVADRVIVMKDGQIVEQIEAERVSEAEHPYTRELLAAVPGAGDAP